MKLTYKVKIVIILLFTIKIFSLISCKTKEKENYNPEPIFGTTTDISGNEYKTVTIGSQTWMAENLKVTKFNDGEIIPKITENIEWSNLTTPGFGWDDNDSIKYANLYGAYYNGYAVESGKLCPVGWHVPSDSEWKTLEISLGMSQSEADKTIWRGTNEGSKLAGNSLLWTNAGLVNDPAFETSGFAALPAGYRANSGITSFEKTIAAWWTSSNYSSKEIWIRNLSWNFTAISRDHLEKNYGLNVRCVKD